MTWFDPHRAPNNDKNDKEKQPMSRRFLTACLLILAGVIALWIALELLAQFWGWLVLAAILVLAVWITIKILQVRKNRW